MPAVSKEELECAFDSRFGKEFKEKICSGRVAVAGLGGLGSNIACMLARSGVDEMLLVDCDAVDVTNLNRQAYMVSHIGMKKTDAILEILHQINPYGKFCVRHELVTEKNAAEIFRGWDIVAEAFDRPENKAMLIGTLLSECPGIKIVSGNGMAGYGDAGLIQTKKVMENLYVCGDGVSDVEEGMGLMAPRVAVCAGHQANKIIQLLAERK